MTKSAMKKKSAGNGKALCYAAFLGAWSLPQFANTGASLLRSATAGRSLALPLAVCVHRTRSVSGPRIKEPEGGRSRARRRRKPARRKASERPAAIDLRRLPRVFANCKNVRPQAHTFRYASPTGNDAGYGDSGGTRLYERLSCAVPDCSIFSCVQAIRHAYGTSRTCMSRWQTAVCHRTDA